MLLKALTIVTVGLAKCLQELQLPTLLQSYLPNGWYWQHCKRHLASQEIGLQWSESRQTQHQKFQHWRQIVILRAGCPEISGHFQNFLDKRGRLLRSLWTYPEVVFLGWGGSLPWNFWAFPESFWWGGRLPWNFAMLAVFFPNFYPMPTHFQQFCGCIVWFIQIWRIAQKNCT